MRVLFYNVAHDTYAEATDPEEIDRRLQDSNEADVSDYEVFEFDFQRRDPNYKVPNFP